MIDKIDPSDFEKGAIFTFDKGDYKGNWEVIEVKKFSIDDIVTWRLVLDKNKNIPGDEIILEFMDNDPTMIYLFEPIEEFHIDDAESWPPPESINIFDTDYNGAGYTEDGLLLEGESGDEARHWEYASEDKFLQIFMQEEMITFSKGVAVHVNNLTLL